MRNGADFDMNPHFLFYKPKASARETRMHSLWSKSLQRN